MILRQYPYLMFRLKRMLGLPLMMTFRHDITLRATEANNIMGIIRRNYTYLDIESFKLLFKSLVRPHIEYGAPVWNPRLKRDIVELEKGPATSHQTGTSTQEYELSRSLVKTLTPNTALQEAKGRYDWDVQVAQRYIWHLITSFDHSRGTAFLSKWYQLPVWMRSRTDWMHTGGITHRCKTGKQF